MRYNCFRCLLSLEIPDRTPQKILKRLTPSCSGFKYPALDTGPFLKLKKLKFDIMFLYLIITFLCHLAFSIPITSNQETMDPNAPTRSPPPPSPKKNPSFTKEEAIVLSVVVLLFGILVIVFVLRRKLKSTSETSGEELPKVRREGGGTYSSLFERLKQNGLISSLFNKESTNQKRDSS